MTRANGNPQDIEIEIGRTRTAIDRTFDAIAGKLTPQRLALDCLGLFRESSTTAASRAVETAREHPVPTAIIGLGIGLLIAEKSKASARAAEPAYGRAEAWAVGDTAVVAHVCNCSEPGHHEHEGSLRARAGEKLHQVTDAVRSGAAEVGDRAAKVKDRAAEVKDRVAGKAAETAQHVRDQVREGVHQVGEQVHGRVDRLKEGATDMQERARVKARDAQIGFWQAMERNPLAVAAGALFAGVAAGMLLPASRKERELLGDARERVKDRAREMGREALGRGREVARNTVESVKNEAARQGITPRDLLDKARAVERETVNTLRTEARGVVQDVAGRDVSPSSPDEARMSYNRTDNR